MKFNEYKNLNLTEVNHSTLDRWNGLNLFERTVHTREGAPSFVFFEGPPSANGHPGIHHVMARTIKDIVCRYKTMRGYQVKRKAGWDTHGLPVELCDRDKNGNTCIAKLTSTYPLPKMN